MLKSVVVGMVAATSLLATASQVAAQAFPADVKGWKAPEPGEHPRLFFRKSDLPELKKRAQTPEGQAIIARLRTLLNGSDGESLPAKFNDTNATGGELQGKPGEVMTLWHPAGYGMLYQLTGDKKYADLGKQCMEKILAGTRDKDARYAFINANGALRAGPSVGAVAMGYDLCYDGWDADFRQKVAAAFSKGSGGDRNFPIEGLVKGARLGVKSNHGGCQIGGGALAVLAAWKDPGVDNERIEDLMKASQKAIVEQVTVGFGDGGYYWEGLGPGGIASDTALIPGIQAWKVAGGKDFITPKMNTASMVLFRGVSGIVMHKNEPWYIIPGGGNSYGNGRLATSGGQSDRDGLSRAAQWSQGFGVLPDELKPVMLWTYNNMINPDPAKRLYDTDSIYPHRPILALVNWPIGVKEVDPNTSMPKVHWDTLHQMYVFRSGWSPKGDDVVVQLVLAGRDPHKLCIWGKDQKIELDAPHKVKANQFFAAEDGSGYVSAGKFQLGVDFSKASGADALIVIVGAKGGKEAKSVTAGGTTFTVIQLGGKAADPVVNGDEVTIGGQSFKSNGQHIVFTKVAGEQKKPRFGYWK